MKEYSSQKHIVYTNSFQLSLCLHSQRDGTLSAGRSAYINYSGMLQQFVQAYISKEQVMNVHKPHLILEKMLKYFNLHEVQPLICGPLRVPLRGKGRCAARLSLC